MVKWNVTIEEVYKQYGIIFMLCIVFGSCFIANSALTIELTNKHEDDETTEGKPRKTFMQIMSGFSIVGGIFLFALSVYVVIMLIRQREQINLGNKVQLLFSGCPSAE
jgi:hypothetical protein